MVFASCILLVKVALLAEGVDRNIALVEDAALAAASPSSRRAWIEILLCGPCVSGSPVALLAEGVDRNDEILTIIDSYKTSPSSRRAWIEIWPLSSPSRLAPWSPSSRRAWIEIASCDRAAVPAVVALLAEGVDRNHRCPQGLDERLKSPSSRRAWIEIAAF